MANKILTPVTLWSDFNDQLPLEEEVIEETEKEKAKISYIAYSGRAIGSERVRIAALFARPLTGDSFPALLILPTADKTFDEALALRFVAKGYAVLMPDYRGKWEGAERFTSYPETVSYGNFAEAGDRLVSVQETAKETTWYEWVAVARYSLQYLKSKDCISQIGVIGIKKGGDVAWQLTATAEGISCAIIVCAGGWNAYRGIYKFGENTELKMDEERHRFLAGVDAQAYAPYAKCPVLMLCSTNDEDFDADRAFDTFARINEAQEKTFYFSARYNGHIGNTAMNDLDLFIDKYLKNREVFIPGPAEITIDEDEGELVAKISFDKNGEVKYCEVYMAEDNMDASTRDWVLCERKYEDKDGYAVFKMNAYNNAKTVYAFAKAKYSCGFAVSSKIAVKRLEKTYSNMCPQSRILYSSKNGTDSFTLDQYDNNVLADCFLDNSVKPVYLVEGPFGIRGVYSSYGLRSYRLNDPRFSPGENAVLKLDAYSEKPTALHAAIYIVRKEEKLKYTCTLRLPGGEAWVNLILNAKDFKNNVNRPLSHFGESTYITFDAEDCFCINNFLWI